MSTPASVDAGKADAKPSAALEEYITLVVKDEEGRRLTRTMRRSDQLQVLMDFHYSMVPTVKHGKGIFVYGWRPISYAGMRTPASFMMKDGDEIRFFPEVYLVTPVLQDLAGRTFTRTMQRTDTMQDMMDFYHDMVPAAAAAVAPGAVFLYCGERVTGEQTPAGLGMKDLDRIYVVPTVRGEVGQEEKQQSDDEYITLKVENYFRDRYRVYRTMRRNEKVRVLMNFCAIPYCRLLSRSSVELSFSKVPAFAT